MTENEKQTYKDGQRDTKIDNLEKRVTRIEVAIVGLVGAVLSSWAKLTGFFGG